MLLFIQDQEGREWEREVREAYHLKYFPATANGLKPICIIVLRDLLFNMKCVGKYLWFVSDEIGSFLSYLLQSQVVLLFQGLTGRCLCLAYVM